jgi:hypothetical protein
MRENNTSGGAVLLADGEGQLDGRLLQLLLLNHGWLIRLNEAGRCGRFISYHSVDSAFDPRRSTSKA